MTRPAERWSPVPDVNYAGAFGKGQWMDRMKRSALVTVAVAALILGVVTGLLFVGGAGQRSPESAVKSYLAALRRRDCKDAVSLLSKSARQQIETAYGEAASLCSRLEESGRIPGGFVVQGVSRSGESGPVEITVEVSYREGTVTEKYLVEEEEGRLVVQPPWA